MSRLRILFLLIVLIIPFITAPPIAGQDEDEVGDVAILVVDVFEDLFETGYESSDQRPPKEELAGEGNNCVVPIDGQDDYTWGGGGGGGVSPILGGRKPHGRLVYEHLQQLIMAADGKRVGQISGSAIQAFIGGNTEWLRDINYYDLPNISNHVVLVSVDADGYTTQSITDRIVATMRELNEVGINRFVINMSFAVVPCDDLLEINEELYRAVLEAIIEGSGDFPPELSEGFEQFRDLFDDLQNDPELLNLITGTGGHDNRTRWAELLRETYYVTVMRPLFHALMGNLYNNGDDVATILPPGDSSDCTAFRISTDPLNTTSDPLFRLLVQLDNRCGLDVEPVPGVPDDIVVVPVASAGNLGFDFPFAPAIWPDVLSVSAEYEDLSDPDICPPVRDIEIGTILATLSDPETRSIIEEVLEQEEITGVDVAGAIDAYLRINQSSPPSNSAEVQMNGIFPTFDGETPAGCYWGTSFAAPRMSLEMAIFLTQKTPPADCNGQASSALALVYNDWDNLPRQDASDNYCPIFNDVLTQFLNPLGIQSVNELDLRP